MAALNRRALLGAAVVAMPAVSLAPAAVDATDSRFQQWEAEILRLDAEADAIDDWDEIDRKFARVGEIEKLIFETRATSRIAAEVKLRTLIRYWGNHDAVAVAPAQDVLVFIGALP